MESNFQLGLSRHEAQEARRKAQQGLGRPIISATLGNTQFVAVGDRTAFGPWKTFGDFLDWNLKQSFTEEWATSEGAIQGENRHPLLQWLDVIAKQQVADVRTAGEVHARPVIGAAAAYFALAYNLYLLDHNAELQRRLLNRLRLKSQFHGAYYETFVSAYFILAGFTITLEDEDHPDSTHCEFWATAPNSGEKYWIEAKARGPLKDHFDVGTQLYKALKKRADEARIIFIDLNVMDNVLKESIVNTLSHAIRSREPHLKINDEPAPAAYVLVTNYPVHLDLEGAPGRRMLVPVGFKIPDFGAGVQYPDLKTAYVAKQRHLSVYKLIDHFRKYTIPSTFDGEVPEFAFGFAERKWLVGQSYEFDGLENGPYLLTSGAVLVEESKAALALIDQSDNTFVHFVDLTAHEVSAFLRHPESFFGEHDRNAVVRRADTPFEMFELLMESYGNTPRTTLLEFLASAPDLAQLELLSDHDLLMEYCTRVVGSMTFK